MNFLRDLVDKYIESQWVNHRRSLNYPEAREELLGCSAMYIYEYQSHNPMAVYADESLSVAHCWPIIADPYGTFPEIHMNTFSFTAKIEGKNGVIAIVDFNTALT